MTPPVVELVFNEGAFEQGCDTYCELGPFMDAVIVEQRGFYEEETTEPLHYYYHYQLLIIPPKTLKPMHEKYQFR